MTLLDEPRARSVDELTDEQEIDLTDQPTRHERAEGEEPRDDVPHETDGPLPHPDIEPSGQIAYRGMRVRRVRLGSVAKISLVFWLLAFGVLVGTAVVVWNAALAFGFVESFEETMVTSLGLETFEIDGGGAFGLVAAGAAVLCALGWLGTIAMAAVYNAACGVLGGLALDTGPLRRRRRVFSWRHRGFVTVSR